MLLGPNLNHSQQQFLSEGSVSFLVKEHGLKVALLTANSHGECHENKMAFCIKSLATIEEKINSMENSWNLAINTTVWPELSCSR